MGEEETKFKKIISLEFIELCYCVHCIHIRPENISFQYYKFKETDVAIALYPQFPNHFIIRYYVGGCPFSVGSRPRPIEEVLDFLPSDITTQIFFNIDLFR